MEKEKGENKKDKKVTVNLVHKLRLLVGEDETKDDASRFIFHS